MWQQTTSGGTTTTTVSMLGMDDLTSVSGGAVAAPRLYTLPGGVTATRKSSSWLIDKATDTLGTRIAALNLSSGLVGE